MEHKISKFPDYFPDGCPPKDATSEEIEVYRTCENSNQVTSDDFISYYNIDPEKYKNVINAYGLSVMLKKEDCVKLMKMPGMKKKFKSIAKGKTYSSMGVVKRTPNKNYKSHCTWWLCEGSKPEEVFEIV